MVTTPVALNQTPADRYKALQDTRLYPDHDRAWREFQAHLAHLRRPVTENEQQEMWTLYRLGRIDERYFELEQRAEEMRREREDRPASPTAGGAGAWQSIDAVVADLDCRLAVWRKDHPRLPWRTDEYGIPLVEDLVAWLSAVRGKAGVRVDLEAWFRNSEVTVSEKGIGDEFDGFSVGDALARMLLDYLQRTCVTCREFDGHDAACPVGQDLAVAGEEG